MRERERGRGRERERAYDTTANGGLESLDCLEEEWGLPCDHACSTKLRTNICFVVLIDEIFSS